MTLQDIKTELGLKENTSIVKFNLARETEADNTTPTPWLAHWDNVGRFRIVLHEDLLATIKADPSMNNLAYKTQVVEGKESTDTQKATAGYIRYVLIAPTNLEDSI